MQTRLDCIIPCSVTRPCGYSAGLAALDLTARGPCILGRAVACGAGASFTPLPALRAGLVRLSGLAADRLVLSTPCGGAAETAGRLDAHLLRLFASSIGWVTGLFSDRGTRGQPRG